MRTAPADRPCPHQRLEGEDMPQKPKALDDTSSVRAWWGLELRNWRQVRGLSTRRLGERVHLSATSIERIEKNERSCDATLAARLDDVLEAGGALRRLWARVEQEAEGLRADADRSRTAGAADAAYLPGSGMLKVHQLELTDGGLSPVERRSFLAAGGLAAVSPVMIGELALHGGSSPLPRTVRPEDVEQVRTAATTLAGWDNLYGGGGLVRETSVGQLRWAEDLLKVKCPPSLRADLFTAVGRLSIVIGASAFDAFEHDDAARLLAFGAACAEAADNWHLRACALNWMARQAIWCDAPDAGLTHAENGLLRSDRLTPREQAMLHNARARALAKMRRRQDALTAVGQSDTAFGRARDGEDVPWMAYYDYAQHHGDTGHALYDIALISGESPRMAADRLMTAMNGHTDAYVRSRALSGTKLATLTMATGDPYEATATANRALNEVGRLRSKRAISDVMALAEASRSSRRIPEVAALRERIRTTVLA